MPIFIIALYTTELIPGACHFPSYKVNVNSLSFGKRVGQNLYIYVDDLEKENNVLHQFVAASTSAGIDMFLFAPQPIMLQIDNTIRNPVTAV